MSIVEIVKTTPTHTAAEESPCGRIERGREVRTRRVPNGDVTLEGCPYCGTAAESGREVRARVVTNEALIPDLNWYMTCIPHRVVSRGAK